MGKIKVKFYKTVRGRDRLQRVLQFDSRTQAMQAAADWEAQTLDNYAVFR